MLKLLRSEMDAVTRLWFLCTVSSCCSCFAALSTAGPRPVSLSKEEKPSMHQKLAFDLQLLKDSGVCLVLFDGSLEACWKKATDSFSEEGDLHQKSGKRSKCASLGTCVPKHSPDHSGQDCTQGADGCLLRTRCQGTRSRLAAKLSQPDMVTGWRCWHLGPLGWGVSCKAGLRKQQTMFPSD